MFSDERLSPSESDAFNAGFEAAFNGEDELRANNFDLGTNEHLSFNDGYHYYFQHEQEREREAHRKLAFESKDPVLARLQAMPMSEVGKLVGDAPETWPSRCFEIASKLVAALDWTDAAAVYGLYLGAIDRKCTAFTPTKRALTRHGWVVTREGIIVDPTAWVFEAVEPYIKVLQPGEDLHFECREWYDEGAESLANLSRGDFPDCHADDKVFIVRSKTLYAALRGMAQSRTLGPAINPRGFTAAQLSWLCRTPYSDWAPKTAQSLYALVQKLGLSAAIPVDYLARAQRESHWRVA